MTNSITLAEQVRYQVTNRIILCGLLLVCVFCLTTIFDVYTNVERLSTTLEITCNELSNFIIEQKLISNEQAIHARLEKMSAGPISFKWIPFETQNATRPRAFQKILWTTSLHWNYFYLIPGLGNKKFGYLRLSSSLWKDTEIINSLIVRCGILLFFFIIALILLYPLAKKIPNELFVAPIQKILNMLKLSREKNDFQSPEILLATELRTVQSEIINLMEKIKTQSHKEALLTIATQVAHDIRSPLAALNVMVKKTDHIPEQQRIVIRNAAQRINDIANNLLSLQRDFENPALNSTKNALDKELIASLIDRVLSEKRIQFQDRDLVINFHAESDTYGTFAEVSAANFKRVISNLINNAEEAITNTGCIDIYLKNLPLQLQIIIKDNGSGMLPELQKRVFEGGISVGKKQGTGIGLVSAKRFIESWGGKLEIESYIHKGTTINIFLPRSQPADWFLSELILFNNDTIIILDDDQSIHDIWESFLEEHNAQDSEIKVHHYYLIEDLLNEKMITPNARFFVDYELRNSKLTGLDIIKKLRIESQSILVTSRDEELSLRRECEKLGTKILPKAFVTHIPIKITAKPDLIFIDDSLNLTNAWKLVGELEGKNVMTFNIFSEAKKFILCLPKNIPIYIDSDLSKGERGDLVAKELYELGYRNLFLSTGYPKENFSHCYWFKAVIGKEPPF